MVVVQSLHQVVVVVVAQALSELMLLEKSVAMVEMVLHLLLQVHR
jgi:hypothetical protein